MARVTYGDTVTAFHGSIGGVTFHNNTSGNIARLRPKAICKPTTQQSPYQRRVAMLAAAWQELSGSQQGDWNDFANDHDHITPWGETKTLNGFQWFLSTNLFRLLRYSTIIQDPPTWYSYSPPDQFTLVATASYLRAEWDPDFDSPTSLLFYLSLPLRRSNINLRLSQFYVAYNFGSATYSYYDLTSLFENLCNVTWSDFYSSAKCSIICRMLALSMLRGLTSTFTSDIVKI